MMRGLNGAAAGMIAQQRRQEMLTDNLNNMNTPGHKADQASLRAFPNMLIQAAGQGVRGGHIGELATGVYMQERIPHFAQGDLMETGNAADLALLQSSVPEGAMLFFAVEGDDGTGRLTRNGSFTVDGEGFLTTAGGRYILDTEGERIQTGSEQFRINEEGSVFVEGAEGEEEIARLGVILAEDPAQLVHEEEGLLRYEGDEADLLPAAGNDEVTYRIEQGFLERSNVDASRTMTEMMAALRSFEANQKILQSYDRSLERTVNDVGRIG
ncbi:flagellar hook-basal body protein [Alteribacter natronophilus]|uniref:flagellar hook-basal body protein n=1 Tax=Alteribacter natronophilus TaxID=2583810 RepID=UPI00110DE574|nr:flagellar hook-basal body protein [Alteribacter natronophilus]TMW72190.1 flagellar hook-basal body protein [Alteribacter natronophilus]